MRHPARVAAAVAASVLLAAAPGAAGPGSVAASVVVDPLAVELTLSRDAVQVGQTVRARASVTNLGSSSLERVALELRLEPSGLLVRGGTTRTVGTLRPGKSAGSSWSVCPQQPGRYLLLAHATAPPFAADSAARLLAVAGGTASCT